MSVENRNFFPFRTVFCVPAEGVSLELVIDEGGHKTRIPGNGVTGQRKKFDDIFSSTDTIHQRDRQTDGYTPADSKDRAFA